jgi:hypothetical protein
MVKMNVIDYITITCNLKNDRLQITSDYMNKCNQLQLITITPCLYQSEQVIGRTWIRANRPRTWPYASMPMVLQVLWYRVFTCNFFFLNLNSTMTYSSFESFWMYRFYLCVINDLIWSFWWFGKYQKWNLNVLVILLNVNHWVKEIWNIDREC